MGHTVADDIGIDIKAGTQYIEWVESEIFPGSIAPFVGNKEGGAMEAKTTLTEMTSYLSEGIVQDWI